MKNKSNNHNPPDPVGRKKVRPPVVHPSIPGAVGSRESPYQEGRDLVDESRRIISETIDRIRGVSPDKQKE
ncbi:MAG: hypothetical protein A2176_00980 [Spirochaetes bacterium RBG_13_51_14]|nr:MAG: hypothetical protein A2176_00980 [Spirochaetes bacterium RBG_13_51_14]